MELNTLYESHSCERSKNHLFILKPNLAHIKTDEISLKSMENGPCTYTSKYG